MPLGYYYWVCGSSEAVAFYRASVHGRIGLAATLVLLIAAFSAPVQLLLFAAVDLAGATWTALGFRKAATVQARPAT